MLSDFVLPLYDAVQGTELAPFFGGRRQAFPRVLAAHIEGGYLFETGMSVGMAAILEAEGAGFEVEAFCLGWAWQRGHVDEAGLAWQLRGLDSCALPGRPPSLWRFAVMWQRLTVNDSASLPPAWFIQEQYLLLLRGVRDRRIADTAIKVWGLAGWDLYPDG